MKQFLLSFVAILSATVVWAQTPANTYTYKQITKLTESHVAGQDWQHVISDNGNKAAWYRQTNPKQVYVINTDGTGQTSIVDMGTDRLTQVDISADGSKVVYVGGPFASGHRANFINADGSGDTPLIELGELRMHTLKIAGDGSKAFFNIYTDANIAGGGGSIERGLYSINLDGTGLTQLAGPATVAGLLGINAADVGPFYGGSNGPSIDVSYDGTEVIFIAKDNANGGHYVFTLHSGVTEILGPYQWLNGVGISADGTKVAASVNDAGSHEGWVANYDGTGLQMIASNDDMFYYTNGNSRGDAVSLTSNGSKVMFDAFGHLFNADRSGVISVSVATMASAAWPMIVGTIERPTMTSDGTRFLFSFADLITSYNQLAIAEINPSSLGDCPALSDFYWSPDGAAPSGQASELRVRVTPSVNADSIWYAGNVALLNNLRDPNVQAHSFSDDGSTAGDDVANDNIYTHWSIAAYSNAELGPRTMRFNSEAYDSELKHFGTAVDVNTWYVADNISVNEHDELVVDMYPNPTDGMVYFNLPTNQFNNLSIEVYNQLGKQLEVHPFVLNQQPMLNTSAWANGLYSISLINTEGQRHTLKLAVVH